MVVSSATDPVSPPGLVVTDVSTIPDEPAEGSWYHHKVRLGDSAK